MVWFTSSMEERTMFAKCLSIVLLVSLLHTLIARPALAQTNVAAKTSAANGVEASLNNYATIAPSVESNETRFAAKVKAAIAKLGTGPDSRIEVKLYDKKSLKGYLSQQGEDSFTVTDYKTGTATQVLYPQVKKVKGNNLSSEKKFSLAVVIGLLVAVAIAYRNFEKP